MTKHKKDKIKSSGIGRIVLTIFRRSVASENPMATSDGHREKQKKVKKVIGSNNMSVRPVFCRKPSCACLQCCHQICSQDHYGRYVK